MKYLFPILFLAIACSSPVSNQTENETLPKEQEELIIPEGNYSFPFEFDYLSHISNDLKEGVLVGEYMEYYVIGWSSDGKIAYARFDDVAIAIMSVFVQDIYTNEEVWEGNYEIMEEEDTPLVTAEVIWEAEQPEISEKLRSFGISPLESKLEMRAFPVEVTLSDGAKHSFAADLRTETGEEGSLISETIFLRREDGTKKQVLANIYDEFDWVEMIELAGGVKTIDKNQLVICSVRKGYGFEGRALYLNFVGADLTTF